MKDYITLAFHTHTAASPDSKSEIADVIKKCEKLGIDVICITDHNAVFKMDALKGIETDVMVIPGVEVSTKEDCHIIGLYAKEDIPYLKLDGATVVKELKKQGAIVIMAHPFRSWQGYLSDRYTHPEEERSYVLSHIDGAEIYNGKSSPPENKKAREFFKDKEVFTMGGSDAHRVNETGNVLMRLYCSKEDLPDALFTAKREIIVDPSYRYFDIPMYYLRRSIKKTLGLFGLTKDHPSYIALRKKTDEAQKKVKKLMGKR